MSKEKEEQPNLRIVIAVFEDNDKAKAALKMMEDDESLGMKRGAVVHQNEKGKVKVNEIGDMGGGKGAVIGGAIGAAVGIIAGPMAIATGAVGAAVGGMFAQFSDGGIPNHKLDEVGAALQPGMSAIVSIVDLKAYEKAKSAIVNAGSFVLTEVPDIHIIKQAIAKAQAVAGGSSE